jgi:beta-galactosidase
MKTFLETLGKHYADCPNLHGWDLWNELRWNEHADELVCFCPHTLESFRNWLCKRYGSLDGLNEAWHRRYIDWRDVMPGKRPDLPYTELMAWQNFITDRADEHGAWRYEIMRSVDPTHVITAHGGAPSIGYVGNHELYALDRGNDWNLAQSLDGIGCSSFPVWQNVDDAAFGSRVEKVRAAAAGKHIWLSEVQGGRAGVGFDITGDVFPEFQQRWLWNGLACGADTILFWCWRDEIFGRESGYFGLGGNDEFSPDRLRAMRASGDLLEQNKELFDGYKPDEPEIAFLFSPDCYYLNWAQESSAERMQTAIDGYARALVKQSIPSTFIEAGHLGDLNRFKVIALPRTIVLDAYAEEKLADFVKNGGTLIVESECGAFDKGGFYRYPEKRFLNQFGICEAGRRQFTSPLTLRMDGKEYSVECEQWFTPLRDTGVAPSRVFAEYKGSPLAAEFICGKGKVIYLGGYFGNCYFKEANPGFEQLLADLAVSAGVNIPFRVLTEKWEKEKFIYVKTGSSGGKRMIFAFFSDAESICRLQFAEKFNGSFTEMQSGRTVTVKDGFMEFPSTRYNLAIFKED